MNRAATIVDKLLEADEFDPREYLLRPPDKAEFVKLAVEAAELVLPIFEQKYPNDNRPRKAIEAAKAWLDSPDVVNAANAAKAAKAATKAATKAANAADAIATSAAAYAADAADAAAYAADAADAAADAADAAACAADADAAWAAAKAASYAAQNSGCTDTTIARIGQIQDEIEALKGRIRESLEDFNARAYLLSTPPNYDDPRIRTSFDIVTPESAQEGDVAESGWIDQEGQPMTPDEDEQAKGITAVQNAIEWLISHNAVHSSASQFHPGIWYSTEPDVDYRTGEEETHNFHLSGFTPEEEKAIWDVVYASI